MWSKERFSVASLRPLLATAPRPSLPDRAARRLYVAWQDGRTAASRARTTSSSPLRRTGRAEPTHAYPVGQRAHLLLARDGGRSADLAQNGEARGCVPLNAHEPRLRDVRAWLSQADRRVARPIEQRRPNLERSAAVEQAVDAIGGSPRPLSAPCWATTSASRSVHGQPVPSALRLSAAERRGRLRFHHWRAGVIVLLPRSLWAMTFC